MLLDVSYDSAEGLVALPNDEGLSNDVWKISDLSKYEAFL